MRTKSTITGLAAAALAVSGSSAQTTYYFSPTGAQQGDWSQGGNWFTGTVCSNLTGPGLVPTELDDVFICGDKIALVTNENAEARTVSVNGSAKIQITPGSESAAKLTLGQPNAGVSTLTSNLYGQITLEQSVDDNHATLTFTGPHHFFSDGIFGGSVIGKSDDATIDLPTSGRGLTLNLVTLRGKCKVIGIGDLRNDGLVQADADGTLLIDISGFLSDSLDSVPLLGDPSWKATVPPSGTAILRFGSSIQHLGGSGFGSLRGDFLIDNVDAKVQIDEMPNLSIDFKTTGRLKMMAGVLDAHNDTDMGSGASSPPSSAPLDMTGGNIVVAPGKTFTHH